MAKTDISHLTFLVAGVARNCGPGLRKDVEIISQALVGAKTVHWLVIESDSEDSTEAVLDSLSSEIQNFRHLSLGNLSSELPSRTERLAYVRNNYLKQLFDSIEYRDVDYLVVADLDGVNRKLSRESFESCWESDGWDACFANQLGPYYDVWALRHPLWSPNDCFEQFEFLKDQAPKLTFLRNERLSVFGRMIRVPKDAAWIPVDSAFGGLGVYRKSVLRNVRYAGTELNGREVCEHVPLNLALKSQGARLFINTAMVNAWYTDHSLRVFTLFRIIERMILKVMIVFGRRRS